MSWNNYLDPNSGNSEQALLNQAWNRENNGLLSNWFNPGSQQQEEFAQQIVLQQMQNDWNSEVSKMERMKEAGINLNTAASGVAGSGSSPSVGSVPSASGAGAAGANALGSLGSAAASMLGSVGETIDKLFTLHPRRKQLLTQARLNFANTGFTDLQSQGLEIALKYADQKEYQSLLNLQSQFETMEMERKVMDAQISELHAQVDELNQRIIKYEHENNLADKKAAEAEKNAAYLQELKIMQEFRNNINKIAHVDTSLPLPNMAAQLFFQNKDEMLQKFLSYVYDYNYEVNAGSYDAQADAAFDKVFNETVASMSVEADYAPYMAKIDIIKNYTKELYKAIIENPDDIKGIVAKAISLMSNLGMANNVDNSLISNSRRPLHQRRQRNQKGVR